MGTPPDRIAACCAGIKETTVVCGHTHSQFERQVGPWHIVNPGSVGNPFGGLVAYWAILDPNLEFRFTPYDVHTTAERILATGFPLGTGWPRKSSLGRRPRMRLDSLRHAQHETLEEPSFTLTHRGAERPPR